MNIKQLLSCIIDFDRHIGGLDKAIESIDHKLDSKEVLRITNDSNQVNPSSVFIALKGTNQDSHEYIDDVRKKDPICVIGQMGVGAQGADLEVNNTRALIGPLCAALNDFPSTKQKLVGVTGTNGKTTVTYLYSSIVKFAQKRCFTFGTTGILVDGKKVSDSLTTPDPVVLQDLLSEYLADDIIDGALEVSSHALDQFRVLGTQFEVVGFTNLSQDHLDYHKTLEDYIEAKLKLFSKDYSTKAVINLDGAFADRFIQRSYGNGLDIFKVSIKNSDSDLFIRVNEMSILGTAVEIFLDVDGDIKSYQLNTPLIGDFNIENMAVAIGMGLQVGFDIQTCISAMSKPMAVPGRLERCEMQSKFEVFVDYAHTPDAIEKAAAVLKPLAKKLIIVFGAGGDRDKSKRPLMGSAASKFADQIIVTSDNPRSEDPMSIIDQIVEGIDVPYLVEVDRYKAIKKAIEIGSEGDVILVAGKGHERGQIFADRVEDFYDMDEIEKILKELEEM